MNSNWSYCPEMLNSGQNWQLFHPVWNLTDVFKNDRAPLLCYFKLCASYHSHRSIQTEVTVWIRPIWVKISDFLSLEIWWMTLKNNRATLLCCFKLCASYHSHWSIQTEVSQETPNLGENWRYFVPCELEIWRMTLKNIRAPPLCYFKLCAICELKLDLRSRNG